MKKLLALLWLLLLSSPSWASFTLNNTVENGGGALSQAATISIPAGHTVGVAVFFNDFNGTGATINSITDSGGNTYVLPATGKVTGSQHSIQTGYSLAIGNSVTSVTGAVSGGAGGFVEIIVWDLTGTGTIAFASSPAALIGSSTTATDGISSGSLTVTSTDAIILGAGRDFNSAVLTHGTSFTIDVASPTTAFYPEHRAVTASAAATFTDATAGNAVIAAGIAFQIAPPVVTNGVIMSKGHPIKSGSAVLYK